MINMSANKFNLPISACVIVGIILSNTSLLYAAETQLVPETVVVPTITVEQPVNPVASKPGGPLLTSMSVRLGPQVMDLPIETIIPEFHFIAPNGNAVALHREIVASSSQTGNKNFNANALINTPADAQKIGAVISGGWGCGTDKYYTTVRAYLLDTEGNRSNDLRYTVHCNGG